MKLSREAIRKAMLLYAVTDRKWTGAKTLLEQAEEALKGGATCLQLREKELDGDKFLAEALEMKALCRRYRTPFIVNDNVEVAVRCGADGVHVGQDDMAAADVRKLIGPDMILGVSARTAAQAVFAQENGADYLGVGAVFATSTKLDAMPVNRDELQTICKTVAIPVVAIGGISAANIAELSGSGVDGVALVSAIFASRDIESECRRLRRMSELMVAPDAR